jgi:hypothetical protein
MKLYATTTSEKGKPVFKSSNETIIIKLTKDHNNAFEIAFDGDILEILNYYTGLIKRIEYKESKM